MRIFLVRSGFSETDGTPVYRSFETLKEAIRFARSIGAKQVTEMEITQASKVAHAENN